MFRWLIRTAAAVLASAGGTLACIALAPLPRYALQPIAFNVAHATASDVAEGRRLARMMCGDCHYAPATRAFSGKPLRDLPSMFGDFVSANITRDSVHGIGQLTDADIARVVRAGVTHDGRLASPMPTFAHLSDRDLVAIIAFLRSDDPLVRAVPRPKTPARPSLLGKAMAHLVLRPKPYPAAAIAAPSAADRVAFGRYLSLHRFDCYKCHSAGFLRVDDERPERSAGFFGGGTMLMSANGTPIWSANLTPDAETGIGTWTEADFVRALRSGFRRDNTLLRSPMSMYPGMTDEEGAAIFAYLRTVPPIRKPRRQPADVAPGLPAASRGEAIYLKYQCTQCHGISGIATHDLTRAVDHLGSPAAIEAWIRNPASVTPGVAMPAWQGVLAEDDYAPLVEYVRRLGGQRVAAAGAQATR
jgi:mono/diheme cytochrome c family protein